MMCRAIKKKTVGGNTARISSFSFSMPLFTAVDRYFAATSAGGFQVPSPGGRIEGGSFFGQ
jgi:hypothetical protein